MFRHLRPLSYFICLSALGLLSNVNAEVTFIPPDANAFKKAIKKLPGRKNKKQEIVQNTPLPEKSPLTPEEIQIDLREPMFTQGVIKTNKGGVIKAEGIRIQAQNIEYINKIENGIRVLKVVAENDLMMEFGDQIFVGDKLEFDFSTRTGTLWNGKTDVDIWFLGGDKIELQRDGSYYIYNAFITTCESNENIWEINSETINISQERTLSANNIQFKFFKVPVFRFPVFRSNLKLFYDSPVKYKVVWDKGLGPRATMRYRVFSWQDVNIFLRLDYRLSRGPGGALETEYWSPDDRTVFITRSYGAYDKIVPEERGTTRYRLQGLLSHQSLDKKTFLHFTYDKFSDVQMINDFKSNDFVIDTQKRTRLLINHQEDNVFGTLSFQPQINKFESINEQLPLITLGVKPFNLGSSGIISENFINGGYLKYVFSQQLHNQLQPIHAARLETQNRLYRPFHFGPVNITPNAGLAAIFYNNNPQNDSVGQLVFTYGGEINTQLYKQFSNKVHKVEPYISYRGLTKPRVANINHYTFSMDDGYYKINQLTLGARNYFFSSNKDLYTPIFLVDVYTNGYFAQNSYSKTFPKFYTYLEWNRPSYNLTSDICWNYQEQVLDYINTKTEITVNEYIAFALEYRHRSKYDWRKANHTDFIVDMAHSIESLLHSPLSDRRDTILGKLFIRFSPKWCLNLESAQGWRRKHDPSYSAINTELTTKLPCNWQLKFAYNHMPGDDRFTTQIQLIK